MASLDIEQRFICALLHSNRNDQDAFSDKQIPLSVFRHREPEVGFIFRYKAKKGRFPTPSIFNTRFDWRAKKVRESLSDVTDTVLSQESYRQIKSIVERTREQIDSGKDMEDIVSFFKNGAANLSTFTAESDDVDVSSSRGPLARYARVKKLSKTKGGSLFLSPWPTLNKIISFCRPEELALIMGRTGMGKTYFLLFWAIFLAEQGHKVLFVSKEMSTQQIEDRIELIRFNIDPNKFKEGKLTRKEERAWVRARLRAKKINLIVTGMETIKGTGFDDIYSKVNKYDPQVVMVDAAYRIVLPDAPKNINQTDYLTRIAQGLKRGARATKKFWAATIQMNRGAEDKQGNTKGGVVNAYGADAWAQESDLMIAINGKRGAENFREHEVVKSRDSGMGNYNVHFDFNGRIKLGEASSSQIHASSPKSTFKPLK